MKVVLLAGGFGTRISEESQFKPKPMIEIGGKPILWHIMKEYAYYGFDEFIICAGYKQYVIKEWFADYFLHNSDITFDFTKGTNDMIIHEQHCEPWKVTVVDTGLNTMTGGRIKRIQKYVGDEPFLMTYGDGVCDVDISKLVDFHKNHGKIATLTAVMLEQQKGVLDIGGDNAVKSFREKSHMDGAPINAGYMVLNPEIFDYIEGDDTVFEKEPLEKLAKEGNSIIYVVLNNEISAIVGVNDIVRENSKEVISKLNKNKIETVMLTGDNTQTAEKIAKEIGITTVISNVTPREKTEVVKKLKAEGKYVMMCGDGINDSPALASSNIGVSVNSGTDIAMDSSDVILTRNDLNSILNLINISKKTIRNIKQNLFWAFFYNSLMIPIAMGLFSKWGITINPMIASFAMVISSLTVTLNALRLKRIKI